MKILIGLLLLAYTCQSFYIDDNNYFYLNTSYSQQTVSFSFNFLFETTTTVNFYSPLLISHQEHKTAGTFNPDNKGIVFDPPFDPERVGYNSYDGQYWFGFKRYLANGTNQNFHKLTMQIKQGQKTYKFIFLLVLNYMPISAMQVYPLNTLYTCGNQLLVSYLYKMNQVDLYLFGDKKYVRFNVLEPWDWGFRYADGQIAYLRHKSREFSKATIIATEKEIIYKCEVTPQNLDVNSITFEDQKTEFTLKQLVKQKAKSLNFQMAPQTQDL